MMRLALAAVEFAFAGNASAQAAADFAAAEARFHPRGDPVEGVEYMLWLSADRSRPALYYPFLVTTEVRRNGELYPVLDFSAAPTVAQLKMQIGRIRNIAPCP